MRCSCAAAPSQRTAVTSSGRRWRVVSAGDGECRKMPSGAVSAQRGVPAGRWLGLPPGDDIGSPVATSAPDPPRGQPRPARSGRRHGFGSHSGCGHTRYSYETGGPRARPRVRGRWLAPAGTRVPRAGPLAWPQALLSAVSDELRRSGSVGCGTGPQWSPAGPAAAGRGWSRPAPPVWRRPTARGGALRSTPGCAPAAGPRPPRRPATPLPAPTCGGAGASRRRAAR